MSDFPSPVTIKNVFVSNFSSPVTMLLGLRKDDVQILEAGVDSVHHFTAFARLIRARINRSVISFADLPHSDFELFSLEEHKDLMQILFP